MCVIDAKYINQKCTNTSLPFVCANKLAQKRVVFGQSRSATRQNGIHQKFTKIEISPIAFHHLFSSSNINKQKFNLIHFTLTGHAIEREQKAKQNKSMLPRNKTKQQQNPVYMSIVAIRIRAKT